MMKVAGKYETDLVFCGVVKKLKTIGSKSLPILIKIVYKIKHTILETTDKNCTTFFTCLTDFGS